MNYKEFNNLKWHKDNMFPDGTSGQEAMNILACYIMEYNDWPYLVEYPASAEQVNTEVLEYILYKLRKRTFWEKLKDLF
jgi:hypothetical protein